MCSGQGVWDTKKNGKTISYTYDAGGNRISKTANGKTTWYVRDASGNVMSVYEQRSDLNSGHLTQTEVHLYGSSRLGIFNSNRDMVNPPTGEISIFERGRKFFELSNHLGNVLVTVSDRKLQVSSGGVTVDYYTADVITANDYYPGGMLLPGRTYQAGSGSYRYSINGQEKTPEIAPNTTTAEFWEYDSRIGKRWNLDPRPNISISPYAAFENNPIWHSDILGDSIAPGRTNGMNFFVTGNKLMRKQDRIEHGGGLKGFFRSAYTWDFIKARVKNVLSFGKLKIIQAESPAEAANKIVTRLGSKGYVANMVVDYHSETFGSADFDPEKDVSTYNSKTVSKYTKPYYALGGTESEAAFKKLAGGYAGSGTICYLGNCWAGGNASPDINVPDRTEQISGWLDGAFVLGNQAAASTMAFVFRSTFIGKISEGYGERAGNLSAIGKHTLSFGNPYPGSIPGGTILKVTLTNFIKIKNNGRIHIQGISD